MKHAHIPVLLVLLGVTVLHAAGEEVAGGIPDTPAGKMFHEFLEVFNTGDLQVLKKYCNENPSFDDPEYWARVYDQYLDLEVHSVSEESSGLLVWLQGRRTRNWVGFKSFFEQETVSIGGVRR